ncbi:MAG: arginine deiminase family protein, partial [Fretibacterium sp.]|nr:arginine deiminase family protein [Fretibacterium sp.]
MKKIQVFSEIGRLKQVILHRPGNELCNISPDLMTDFLFDEVPFLRGAIAEHDAFAAKLRDCGAEVIYLEDLASEAIENGGVREAFVDEFIGETYVTSKDEIRMLKDFLLGIPKTRDMVLQIMAGNRRTSFPKREYTSLVDFVDTEYPFITNPMPNLYFTRDSFS